MPLGDSSSNPIPLAYPADQFSQDLSPSLLILWYSYTAPFKGAMTASYLYESGTPGSVGVRLYVVNPDNSIQLIQEISFTQDNVGASDRTKFAMKPTQAGQKFLIRVRTTGSSTARINVIFGVSTEALAGSDWLDSDYSFGDDRDGVNYGPAREWYNLFGSSRTDHYTTGWSSGNEIITETGAGENVDDMPAARVAADAGLGAVDTNDLVGGYSGSYYYDGGHVPGINHNIVSTAYGVIATGYTHGSTYNEDVFSNDNIAYNPLLQHSKSNGLADLIGDGPYKAIINFSERANRDILVEYEENFNPYEGQPLFKFRADLVYHIGYNWSRTNTSFGVAGPGPTWVNPDAVDMEVRDLRGIGDTASDVINTLDTVGWKTYDQVASYPLVKSTPMPSGGQGSYADSYTWDDGGSPRTDYNMTVWQEGVNLYDGQEKLLAVMFTTDLYTEQKSINWAAIKAAGDAVTSELIKNINLIWSLNAYAWTIALTYPRYKYTIYKPYTGAVIKMPPMRQLQRDDNLAGNAPRAFRVGASLQSNLRGGGNVYY